MESKIHEDCGVAVIRLLKPLDYYQQKYGTWMYALNKLYLMMEKEHNRGQEGAGIACCKLNTEPGNEYMFRERAEGSNAITEIFGAVQHKFRDLTPQQLADAKWAKANFALRGRALHGSSALLHNRQERHYVRASLLETQQLEGKEPLRVRQLQHDQRG